MRIPGNLHIDDAAWPLLQGLISYVGVTSADGAADGTTVVDAALADEPSYDGLTIKILSGNAAGQARAVQYHPGSNTITVGVGFTDNAGATVQIVSGTRFMVLTSQAGGSGPGPSPEESLTYYGIVSAIPAANQFTIPALAGLGASKFLGANPYWAFVLRDAGGAGAAPQGELQPLTAYTTGTGVFAHAAFTVALAVGDEILVIHPALAAALIAGWLATGTLTTSSATVPADTGRTEANDYWNGSWLMTVTGAVRMQPRLIVDFTVTTGVFTLDAEQPFTAAPGLVAYVILPPNSQLVPAADSASNQTPAHVVGNKTDTIPAMNLAPGADSLQRQVKAILERIGATPADPDDSLLTSVGQRDAAATADDLSDITTTDAQAKLRRLLLRFSSNAFAATIQGGAQTDVETMFGQMATYFVAVGAAMSIQINGNLARTNLQQVWQDFSVVFGADGANVFNPTIQGAARTDLDTALNQLASYLSLAGAAMSMQVNGNAARTNIEQAFEDFVAVFGADGANVFNPTIQGAARTDLDTALAQLATYFVAAGAAMSLQVNGNAARTNLQQILNDYFAVVGCDGANVFSSTIQGAARTTIEAAFDSLATYFSAAGAAWSVQVNGNLARTNLEQSFEDLTAVFGADGANVFNPTIQGAARTDLDTALAQLATYFVAAGAAMALQINNNPARTNLQQAITDFASVFGADNANVFNPTIQGAARTDLDAALNQLASYFVAAGAAMALQVNGNAARTNLEQALNDFFAVVGADGANVFSTTIQGVARTTIETAFDGLAAYFVAAGAALSVTIDPGGAARTTLATLWNDLGQMLAGGAGITTWPTRVIAGNGVSMAENDRYVAELKPHFATPVSATWTTTAGTEETAFTVTPIGPGLFYLTLDIASIVAGDDITIRIYQRVDGATYRLLSEQQFVGAQNLTVYQPTGIYCDATALLQIRTLRTSGTNRAFPYRYSILQQPVA